MKWTGLSAGMSARDFDSAALRAGTEVELEHTRDRSLAQRIAMDHLVEDPRYYEKLAVIEALPNRRVRVYEAEDLAREMRETFTAKKTQKRVRFPFHWPSELQNVGDSLAVAYSSDKWKKDGDFELYKHLAESRNRVLCVPGFLRDWDDPSRPWGTLGPLVSFHDVPMPRDFAILARFEEADLQLYTRGSDAEPAFGDTDDGVVKVVVRHGMLGGSKFLWSQLDPEAEDEPFLFVYDEKNGPLMLIVGEELDILADGIVG